jgi:hypothetical protein
MPPTRRAVTLAETRSCRAQGSSAAGMTGSLPCPGSSAGSRELFQPRTQADGKPVTQSNPSHRAPAQRAAVRYVVVCRAHDHGCRAGRGILRVHQGDSVHGDRHVIHARRRLERKVIRAERKEDRLRDRRRTPGAGWPAGTAPARCMRTLPDRCHGVLCAGWQGTGVTWAVCRPPGQE